ncbi:MAG: exopolyphosphatase, partial [Lachnospiraceae bacterium]|nr:exopolyphosphatase [Lachnospiraceae bacterium]
MKTFAAIDVGSYELAMKIFEISSGSGLREIDHIRHRIDLGTDTFATGKISYDRVDELSRVLRDYRDIMKSYRVDDYRAYGTSAIRETENTAIVLDQIAQRTGIRIEVLSNSEQRFLNYKAIASR